MISRLKEKSNDPVLTGSEITSVSQDPGRRAAEGPFGTSEQPLNRAHLQAK